MVPRDGFTRIGEQCAQAVALGRSARLVHRPRGHSRRIGGQAARPRARPHRNAIAGARAYARGLPGGLDRILGADTVNQ